MFNELRNTVLAYHDANDKDHALIKEKEEKDNTNMDDRVTRLENTIDLMKKVKPSTESSSAGPTVVDNSADLLDALNDITEKMKKEF